jgi:hypothetical protein
MMSSVAIMERPPFGRPFHLHCMLPYHRRDDGPLAFAPFTIFSNKLNGMRGEGESYSAPLVGRVLVAHAAERKSGGNRLERPPA